MIEFSKIMSAIYIFADIRGFTEWAEKNQMEIKDLLDAFYSEGTNWFGEKKDQTYHRRIVKFIGDGFFAVNEYNDEKDTEFDKRIESTINSAIQMISNFSIFLEKSNIHEKDRLGIGIGIAYGPSLAFKLTGGYFDYAGKYVNVASRLCSAAKNKEIILETDIYEYLSESAKNIITKFKIAVGTKQIKNANSLKVAIIRIR